MAFFYSPLYLKGGGTPLKLKRINKSKPCMKQTDEITLETFYEVFKEFLAIKKLEGSSDRTIADYQHHINIYFKRFLEIERISETELLNIGLIRNYIGHMQDKNLKSSTINVRLRTLRAYIRWLSKEGLINNSIPTRFRLVKQEEKKIRILTDLQIKKLYNVIDTSKYTGFRDYVLITMMLETGIRCNELVNIQIEDVDLERRLVIVRASTAKTRKERHLPITKTLKRYLKEMVEIAKPTDYDYIFQKQTTGGLSTGSVRKVLSDYGKLAKIKTTVSPHILRHTFASNFIKKGGDVFTLSTILGHTTIQMSRRYVNLDSEEIRKIYDKFFG